MACTQHFVLLFNINTTINGICRLEVRFHQTSEHRFVQNCLFVCTTNNAGPVFVCTKSICRMRERKGEREYRHNRQEFIIFLYLKIILVIITCVVICAKNRFSRLSLSLILSLFLFLTIFVYNFVILFVRFTSSSFFTYYFVSLFTMAFFLSLSPFHSPLVIVYVHLSGFLVFILCMWECVRASTRI